ncbi:MAG TPA: ABC transporter, partial [Thermodesulfobacteriota bacterium]|nr:ABC transporter [Thermodesulfobacteriota bacterium]
MHSIFILARKEFRSYFDSPVAYVFIIAFLSFSSWLFFRGFFLLGQVQMRDYFFFLPWIFLIFIPAISMRLWAEEKKMGTIEILMTLPVK